MTAFATAQQRLGASTIRRLANATAVVVPGGRSVEGIFTRRTVEASLGQSGMVALQVDFACLRADAQAAEIEDGTQLDITSPALGLAGESWEVTLRTNDVDLGQALLDLKRVE
jgi:hypothetical protein